MQLINQLGKELKERGVSVLKLSNETGISAYKIYKWLDGKGNPKHEDAKILEQWLRKELEEVPKQGTQKTPAEPGHIEFLREVIEDLRGDKQRLLNQQEASAKIESRLGLVEEALQRIEQMLKDSLRPAPQKSSGKDGDRPAEVRIKTVKN